MTDYSDMPEFERVILAEEIDARRKGVSEDDIKESSEFARKLHLWGNMPLVMRERHELILQGVFYG